jgi:hypothetical protein
MNEPPCFFERSLRTTRGFIGRLLDAIQEPFALLGRNVDTFRPSTPVHRATPENLLQLDCSEKLSIAAKRRNKSNPLVQARDVVSERGGRDAAGWHSDDGAADCRLHPKADRLRSEKNSPPLASSLRIASSRSSRS